jgi:hypothetical protein
LPNGYDWIKIKGTLGMIYVLKVDWWHRQIDPIGSFISKPQFFYQGGILFIMVSLAFT